MKPIGPIIVTAAHLKPKIVSALIDSVLAQPMRNAVRTFARHSALNRLTQRRIAVAIANLRNCAYSLEGAIEQANRDGMNGNEIDANCQGTSQDARADKAVAFACYVLEQTGAVGDDDLDELRWAGYSDGEIIEIIALISWSVFSNYLPRAV